MSLHFQKLRTGRRHAQSRRIGSPDPGYERLHKPLKSLTAQATHREVLERFVVVLMTRRMPSRHKTLCQDAQFCQRRKHRCRNDAPDLSRRHKPKPCGHGDRAAGVVNQRPTHSWIHADEFAREAHALDHRNSFWPCRQKTVGRSLDEPATTTHRRHHTSQTARWLNHRH